MAFPSRPGLSAIVQMATLNRQGLVADCIFPQVKTGCKFAYVDWSNDINAAKIVDANISCKTDVHEVDAVPFVLKDASLKDQALAQVLDECCVSICGLDSAQAKIEAGKTRQLLNKLLVAREKQAIDLATNVDSYTNASTALPESYSGGTDGVKFDLTNANLIDANFALLKYFLGVQSNRVISSPRTTMVTDQATLNKILSHPNFIGSGCMIDPMTTNDKVAALLGLNKICVADAKFNNGVSEEVPTIAKLWPAGTILFTSSYEFITSQDESFAFGISAYDQGFVQTNWIDEKKGKGAGATMQKIGHDITPVVLSFKGATLIKIT